MLLPQDSGRHVFAVGNKLAVGIARINPDHSHAACLAAYDGLLEKDRTPGGKPGAISVFASDNREHVVALVDVHGFGGFRLAASWDEHHRGSQLSGAGEPISLASYEVASVIGASYFDPMTSDVYAFERVERPAEPVTELFASLADSNDFRGAVILKGQAAVAVAILARFSYPTTYEAFRNGRVAVNLLGRAGESSEPPIVGHPRERSALF